MSMGHTSVESGTHDVRGRIEFDPLSSRGIACALEVHTALGPGLLESAYEQCLAHELTVTGIPFELQHPLPVTYKGVHLDCGYRLDFVIDQQLVLELKSVDALLPIHEAQLLTYLKLSGIHVGLLMNFNTIHLRDGIKRMVL
jgi:GxxExxY protein